MIDSASLNVNTSGALELLNKVSKGGSSPVNNIPEPEKVEPVKSEASSPVEPKQPLKQSFRSTEEVDPFVSDFVNDLNKSTEVSVNEPKNPQEDKKQVLDATQEDTTTAAQELLEQVTDKVRKGPGDSLKDLRKKSHELKTQLETREQELVELQTKISKYENGEVIPESLLAKEEATKNRIKELEYYERLFSLETSPEFNEKYLAPLEDLKQQGEALARDYNVDLQVMNRAFNIENKRELNTFLKQHFDEVGALEVRNIIDQMKDVAGKMEAAKREPERELEKIKTDAAKREIERVTDAINGISGVAKVGWHDSLNELSSSGDYPELTMTDDVEHNTKIVNPLRTTAATEYGKCIKALVGLGLKELPKDLAKTLARVFQLGYASSIISESRAQHYRRAEEVIRDNKRLSPVYYPPVNGSSSGVGTASKQKSTTMNDAAMAALNIAHERVKK